MSDPDPNPPNRIQPDPTTPLTNLSLIKTRLDSLTRHLTQSLNSHVILPPHHLSAISSELTSSIHHVILNATALLQQTRPKPEPNIIELDAVELLAEHVHVCTLCGKGFKRDANLRMHMRAHGDQYKSPQALAKPPAAEPAAGSATGVCDTRFSCPFVGCNRNKDSVGFKALKSVVCVKNHFKRSHCPKKFKCERCNVKSFAVVGDLRSHLRVCGSSGPGTGVGGDEGSEFDGLLEGFLDGDSVDGFFRF